MITRLIFINTEGKEIGTEEYNPVTTSVSQIPLAGDEIIGRYHEGLVQRRTFSYQRDYINIYIRIS